MTIGEGAAREAARIRGRGALAATLLCDVVSLGAAALASGGPAEVEPLLWAAAAVGAVAGLGCVLVLTANRRLEADPRDARPVVRLGAVSAVVVLAWVLAVGAVLVVTGDAGWALASVGLVTLVLPPVVLAMVTARGPHPA